MTDLQYSSPPPTDTGRDATAVMGRRSIAWVIDLLIYLAVMVGTFAALAEYVEVPSGLSFLDPCEIIETDFPDEAASCLEVGDRAYITTDSDNNVQLLVSFGYFAFFVVVQGLLGASPGKLVTGLRVVREDGARAGVGRSMLRTVLWVVDGAPWFAPLVGLVTGLTTTGHRRVGDMAASTYVVARADVGHPVSTGAGVSPPPGAPWGAPPAGPPMGAGPGQPPGQMPGQMPPVAPPAAPPAPSPSTGFSPPVAAPTPEPAAPSAADMPTMPSVDDLTPTISGAPPTEPAPPPVVDDTPPESTSPFDAPSSDAPTLPDGSDDATTRMPEVDSPVDHAAPEVDVDPEWWSGPEARPGGPTSEGADPDAGDSPVDEAAASATVPDWAQPGAPETPTAAEVWEPPTTPGEDFEHLEDSSPTAGPTPFAAPGADPVADAPATEPAPEPMPPPQWDQARNTYIQWDPRRQQWLQWDTAGNRWIDII